jgi:hypothetical protein
MYMIRNRVLLKGFAVFFLLEVIFDTVTPAVSWALTSGPTAPEATSFEPVDTTDMVNLNSGDLTYNLPLLEVPGPAGSYPLSLSYHAGIQPNEEASWVGLGFTVNPGAISRNVSGYPDDFKDVLNVDRQAWAGGSTETYSIGISYGIAQTPASVSFGLSFSQDTYQGFGVGGQLGIGLSAAMSENVGINTSVSVGTNPYGGSYTSVGLGVGMRATENSVLSLNAGVNYGTNSGFAGSVSVSAMGGSSVSASISSNGANVSASLRGASGYSQVHNARAGTLSTRSSSFGIDIPVYAGFSISHGYNYIRYWSDETAQVAVSGSLYFPKQKIENFDNRAYDTYAILPTTVNIANSPTPEEHLGGSFPSYDNYFVVAQGLSGAIQPYTYKGLIFRQNRKQSGGQGYSTKQYRYHDDEYINEKTEFRFIHDFSNKFLYAGGEVTRADNPVKVNFDNSHQTGNEDSPGYNDNHLAGSRHIEWYTNRDILTSTNKNPKSDGYIDCTAEGFDRWNTRQDQIGAFMITNESGVTYHYGLPVYTKNEYVYSENVNKEKGDTYNSISRPEPYAYSWLLTSVTGPDYVDRNGNGRADEGDWGYWVDFTYKKYASDYKWRNPSEGYHTDLDNDFQNYSSGQKEIYYLETVRTESHVAVFKKSERIDSREVTNLTEGGFEPQSYTTTDGVQYVNTKSGLRLDRIVLFKADDYDAGKVSDIYTLRSINFQYNYSLVPGTSNSFDISDPSDKLGKLTLLSVEFGGKSGGGTALIPPVKFEYDIEASILGSAQVTSVGTGESSAVISLPVNNSIISQLEPGNIVRFAQSGNILYGYVVAVSLPSNTISISLLKGNVSLGGVTNLTETKNAPYHHDKYDIWNYYKVDIPERGPLNDENTRRMVSEISSKSVDVWSLRRIKNSIGSVTEMEYESDDYSRSVVSPNYQFGIEHIYAKEGDANHVFVRLTYQRDVRSLFRPNDLINLLMVLNSENAPCGTFSPYVLPVNNIKISGFNEADNSIILEDLNLRSYFYHNNCSNLNDFVAGHIGTTAQIKRYGGGLRVKSIKLATTSKTKKTSYTYTFNGCDSESGTCTSAGVTTYEPYTFGTSIKKAVKYKVDNSYPNASGGSYSASAYNQLFYATSSQLLGLTRQLPAPGVMYDEVKVSESVVHGNDEQKLLNHSIYEFETFQSAMVKVVDVKPYTEENVAESTYDNFVYTSIGLRDCAIKDYTSQVGKLKRITLYKGTAKISETENKYVHDEYGNYDDLLDFYNDQGVVQETFIDVKFQQHAKLQGIVSRRHTYPAILKQQINTNYLTGTRTTTTNLAYDFYSGVLTKVLSTDSYGNRFLTETNAAYKQYDAMGLKVYDVHNKNMLTQTADEYSYIVNENNVPTGVLSASVQTWSDDVPVLNLNSGQTNIWRKEAVYQWNGSVGLQTDGSYSYSDFSAHPFNWQNPSVNDRWEKTGEVTLYDIYSHGLEGKDINNNYVATRMSTDQMRVIASGTNARYDEIAYAGAEYYAGNADNEGGVNRGEGNASKAHTHTGNYSLLVGVGKKGFNYTLSYGNAGLDKKYKASVWVYAPGEAETQADLSTLKLYYSINGKEIASASPVLQKNKSKSWYLLSLDIVPIGGDPIYIGVRNGSSRGVYFDDFRVHPLNGSLTSYVYDTFSGELRYILDNNNFYMRFEYDARGRLIRTTKELLNFDFGTGKESYRADAILSEVKYNFEKSN